MDQHGDGRIFEDNVVLGVALREFFSDFDVEVVARILRLPIAEGKADRMEDRAVGPDTGFLNRGKFILSGKLPVELARPGLEEILESL
ncbi:hypothetical protein [Agrobacterium cavarae]|uniref:hypothetical protein n=1 Tax=Agrobacterium cavarae TaxID=2528239 RepID=UPI00289DD072|nr:hypothetical protein [Agrobacterium cavarae]